MTDGHSFNNISLSGTNDSLTEGVKIMNLGGAGTTDGVAALRPDNDDDDDDDDAVKNDDPNAPKSAESGFMFFCQMERHSLKPGLSFGDAAKVIGDKWLQMSAEEREPYEAKAQVDKKRYRDAISDYQNPRPMLVDPGNESEEEPKIEKASSTKGLPLEKKALATEEGSSKDPNAPKKAINGYKFFCRMEIENLKRTQPGLAFGDAVQMIGDKWRQMSAEEREPYEAKAADAFRLRAQVLQ